MEESLLEQNLLRRGDAFIVAVSGGLDSMVLLHLLHALASERNWKIIVAHFNHQLRGRASDADERFVRRTAAKLRVPFETGRGDVKSLAAREGLSIEMAARRLRHEFLARVARKHRAQKIVLAHHADDQVELFFLRLLRGAGSEGLAGMKSTAPSPADPKLRLIRPLLSAGREDLELFARDRRIRHREDASNACLDVQRNRLRRDLIPLLKERHQPALTRTVLRTMEILGAESGFVTRAAQDWLQKRRPRFAALPVAVQRQCLYRQLLELGIPPEFELIERLRLEPDRRFNVNPALSISRDAQGTVRLQATRAAAEFRTDEAGIDVSRAGHTQFGPLTISWRVRRLTDLSLPRERQCEFFDARKIGARVVLRHWRAGDRFQLIGRGSPRKLQDVFTDLKIPGAERRGRVVAVAENGELFWVEGLRISERFKLDAGTKRRLEWRWARS